MWISEFKGLENRLDLLSQPIRTGSRYDNGYLNTCSVILNNAYGKKYNVHII